MVECSFPDKVVVGSNPVAVTETPLNITNGKIIVKG